jgi:hypothetical protein
MPRVRTGFSAPWLNLLDRREALRQRHLGSQFFSLDAAVAPVNNVLRSSLKMDERERLGCRAALG